MAVCANVYVIKFLGAQIHWTSLLIRSLHIYISFLSMLKVQPVVVWVGYKVGFSLPLSSHPVVTEKRVEKRCNLHFLSDRLKKRVK